MSMNRKLLINKILHIAEIRRIKTNEKIVYLTFDDGPEEGITEFVLCQLAKYDFKATFFCKGINAEKHKEMLNRIIKEGHSVGNHTYNHIKGFDYRTNQYWNDVELADMILKTPLFRPPWGALTLLQFIKLRRKYKIVYWSLVSGDTLLDKFELKQNIERLKNCTRPGDIILFHCCKRHENETKQILPLYLHWLAEQGYKTELLS